MDRYSLIHSKMPRELVLLQGCGCKWRRCAFCDYHADVSENPYDVNIKVLERVTGHYGVLDVINSGSAMELDGRTLECLRNIAQQKNIHTLWFEAHYMYRHRLEEFASLFAPVSVKFRCGIESFSSTLRAVWNKGIPHDVTPEDVARYFNGVCLLCCTQGDTQERILKDIETAKRYFEYFSINLFCNNNTPVKRDDELARWFMSEVYPTIKNDDKIEVLADNRDLGVG